MALQKDKLTALYCRLSKDDGEDERDSNSIVNQKDMLLKYAKEHGFKNTQFFIDDGVTGTSFNRPGLNALLAEVKAGRVATVIIKDQSRIGRDVLEVGLLKRTFEENDVRLIAAADGLDTANGFDIMSIFRDVFNEWFVADTSKKLRAVFAAKAKNGLHANAQAPYGYMPSPENKFVWAIDEEAAEIVREIYQMCISGMGPFVITQALRERKVKIPLVRKAERDGTPVRRDLMFEDYNWSHRTICTILENREYTGTAIIGKVTSKSYKDRRHFIKPEDEWSVHENAHPAIIDIETFEIVQRIRNNRVRRTNKGEVGIMNGLMFCSTCGSRLNAKTQTRARKDGTKISYTYYVCRLSRGCHDHPSCTPHSISKPDMEALALERIQRIVALANKDEAEFMRELNAESGKNSENAHKKAVRELTKAKNRIAALNRIINKTYEDNVEGRISNERFDTMLAAYESEQAELKVKAAELELLVAQVSEQSEGAEKFMRVVRSHKNIEMLTAEIVREFIEKIIVGEPQYIPGKGHREKEQEIEFIYNYVGRLPSSIEFEKQE